MLILVLDIIWAFVQFPKREFPSWVALLITSELEYFYWHKLEYQSQSESTMELNFVHIGI